MALYLQRNVYCPECDRTFKSVMVKVPEDDKDKQYLCRECGTRCDILETTSIGNSTVNRGSRSYKFGKHIDKVKEQRYNIARSIKK